MTPIVLALVWDVLSQKSKDLLKLSLSAWTATHVGHPIASWIIAVPKLKPVVVVADRIPMVASRVATAATASRA